MIRIALAFLAIAFAAGPALADPNCLQSGSGFRVEIGVGAGNFSERDQMDFLVMQARRHGINADTAEKTWLECIKITRREAGRWVTEYYDPYTWDLVQ
jgi:hypothetical protein